MNVRHTLNGTERTSGSRCSSPVANNGRDATSGGLLWVVAIVLEYSQHLQPPSAGALFYIDQLMFVVALGCWATAVWACDEWRPPATGWAGTPSRRGRSATSSWRRARSSRPCWTCSSRCRRPRTRTTRFRRSAVLSPSSPRLPPVFAIVRAHRLTGWSRRVVLGFAVYVFGFLFVSLFLAIGVDAVRETIWGLWWIAIGVVLLRYRPWGED